MSEGQPRSSTKNLSRRIAPQIPQNATASVKALAEPSRPKLRVVDPLDYEGELNSRRRDLEREQFLNLLLFPQQDISVSEEEWVRRTEVSSVPQDSLKEAPNLFTAECLKFYVSQWHRVTYNYCRFSSSFTQVMNPEYRQNLPMETFELDLIEEEQLASLSSVDVVDSAPPLSKRGYLYKGPFPSDGGISVSMKNYRKRWCVLTGGSNQEEYSLIFYKDEKGSNVKAKVALDTITEIKMNSRHKQYGFDLIAEEEKTFYPLGADSEAEMEEWITVLNRAIGLEMEEPISPVSSYYQQETLKHAKLDIRPEMLEYTSTTDETNAHNREKDRHPLFHVYPELMQGSATVDDHKPHAPLPEEKFGFRFLVKCHELKMKLTTQRNGQTSHIEPFFLTLALYDAQKGVKISENFHVDLNSPALRQMVPPSLGTTEKGPHLLSDKATRATTGVFSVTFPHPEVYLVARVEKILQSGITASAEPYIKTGENTKAAQKLAQQMGPVCSRLGQYRMPFAWAARPLFTTLEELDPTAEFSPFYKQERERLGDEELLKTLAEFKNIHKQKLQIIPGSLSVEVLRAQTDFTPTLTSSLLPVRSTRSEEVEEERRDGGKTELTRSLPPPTLEVQEFPPLEAYHPHTHYHPHLTLTHHLYIYPLFLKYDAQKAFAKARNIACSISFKDSDDKSAQPLPVIYSKTVGETFTDRANTTVLHHCTSPSFYEEVKVKLPVQLHAGHHLLFTFYHISCDVQKAAKTSKTSTRLPPVETAVGYAWLPLMDSNGRVCSGSQNIAVAATLPPGYLGHTVQPTSSLGRGVTSPDMKWVDGHKPLFRVTTKLDSTIYTEDSDLHHFFSLCEHMNSGEYALPTRDLSTALKALAELSLTTLVHFLPMVLMQLFRVLLHSSKEMEGVKNHVLILLTVLVDRVVNADGTELLRSYIEYMFVTELDGSKRRAVHDELARLLVQYLKKLENPQRLTMVLDHLWFFLEVMLKSMAQYLPLAKKTTASRKTRYPEDFGWNLQNFVTVLLTHIRERHSDLSAKRANRSLADFVKRSFSFMDRGVVFKIVARYLEAFSVKESLALSELKLEFLRIVSDHEHFVSLNLPFPIASEDMEYTLSDEFCRRHFLVGMLLREVENALLYETGPVRKRTIKILRNLLTKHDCDPRYAEPGQKARISAIYFPLIPLVLDHVTRLDPGTTLYISPMLNATSMALFASASGGGPKSPSVFDSMPGSRTGTLQSTDNRGGSLERAGVSGLELTSIKSTHSKAPAPPTSLTSAPQLPRTDSDLPLSPSSVPDSGSVSPEQTWLETDQLGVEETRDLLVSVMFVLKHLDNTVLLHWWGECLSGCQVWNSQEENFPSQFSQLLVFFDMLETSLYTFKYTGKRAIGMKLSVQPTMQREASELSLPPTPSHPPPSQKEKMSKKHSSGSLNLGRSKVLQSSSTLGIPSPSSSLPPTSAPFSLLPSLPEVPSSEIQLHAKVEGALSNEIGLIIISLLDCFSANFKKEMCQDDGDNIIMVKYFTLLVSFLKVNQSLTLQTHVFTFFRAFVHKFQQTLFRGSADCCGILCYEVLQCCNSRMLSTRTEATLLLYLLMRCNFEYFKGHGFVRTYLQSTIGVSKIVSALLGQSDSNLRRSLATIASYVGQDERVQNTPFPAEVKDLMKRLKTVLSATAQMKAHQNDPEKLVDLHYSLAKSYGNSPELRQTWLDSMATLHLKYGNYSEAAHCCIHIAGLVAQYLKIKGKYPAGCAAFCLVSPNVELEESGIKEDKEQSEEQTYTEHNLVSLLVSSINYLEHAERYEMMAEVFKLLQPFYEKHREFKHMTEMYGKLHTAFRKVVDIMATGKRYLGTYFRVAFFGKPFGDDNEKQYIYKEPHVTTLAELTLRLQKLYSKKFGPELVHIIQESGKVNPTSLDLDHAHIQITHVEPYFTSEELQERRTKFERENKISRFVFETPFTLDGRAHGQVTQQCMRKTILTTSHWFPYVKKRIQVIDQEQFELSAIEVAIEAMDKKTFDLSSTVQMDPPDLKRLQLLLQGSISTQVNQGVQEYTIFLREPQLAAQPKKHTERLKEVYRSFMQVCQEALDLNGHLISTDQLMYQDELRNKFQQMQATLTPLLQAEEPKLSSSQSDTFPCNKKSPMKADPHRMSTILFHSISGSK